MLKTLTSLFKRHCESAYCLSLSLSPAAIECHIFKKESSRYKVERLGNFVSDARKNDE